MKERFLSIKGNDRKLIIQIIASIQQIEKVISRILLTDHKTPPPLPYMLEKGF